MLDNLKIDDTYHIKETRANFNLSEVINHHLLGIEVMAFERGIWLDYNIKPNIEIYGAKEQISQGVMILLDIAIKYIKPQGHIKAELSTVWGASGLKSF